MASKYPKVLGEKLLQRDEEFRNSITPEARFAYAIDKMDALIHELDYPQDWGGKFNEENVRVWFQPAFDYSQAFSNYFEGIMTYLKKNKYFETTSF